MKLLCLHYLDLKNGGPFIRCDRELNHEGKHYDSKHDQEWSD